MAMCHLFLDNFQDTVWLFFSLKIDISGCMCIYLYRNCPRFTTVRREACERKGGMHIESPHKLKAMGFSKIGKNPGKLNMRQSTNLWAAIVLSLKYFLLKSDLAQKPYGYLTDKEQSKIFKFLHWGKEQLCASTSFLLPVFIFLTPVLTHPSS